ncbi:hypothetical protein [Actinomadura soli]|uniref:hypothetical protein n=1 Tax=Actinomadura soli TaxID=2508997 RepID=UPI00197A9F35|nr:hypothetical protein [Actinomadura soli]
MSSPTCTKTLSVASAPRPRRSTSPPSAPTWNATAGVQVADDHGHVRDAFDAQRLLVAPVGRREPGTEPGVLQALTASTSTNSMAPWLSLGWV